MRTQSVRLTPSSATVLLTALNVTDELNLISDRAGHNAVVFDVFVGGSDTSHRVTLKPDGIWEMQTLIEVPSEPLTAQASA